jgi:hypothetical protein
MLSASSRRPRALARFFGLILSVLSISGQIALTLHNHPLNLRRDDRAALAQRDEAGVEAHCPLCALSAQSRGACAPAAAFVAAPAAVFAVLETQVPASGRAPALRASSRAPPAA